MADRVCLNGAKLNESRNKNRMPNPTAKSKATQNNFVIIDFGANKSPKVSGLLFM